MKAIRFLNSFGNVLFHLVLDFSWQVVMGNFPLQANLFDECGDGVTPGAW